MRFLQKLFWFLHKSNQIRERGESCSIADCSRPRLKKSRTMTLWGIKVHTEFPVCLRHAEKYLNSTPYIVCASCGSPIFPGEFVGQVDRFEVARYVHLTRECCPIADLYCGTWGEGQLMGIAKKRSRAQPVGADCVIDY